MEQEKITNMQWVDRILKLTKPKKGRPRKRANPKDTLTDEDNIRP